MFDNIIVYSFVDLLTLASGFSQAAGGNFLGFMTCCWNSLGPASALELAVFFGWRGSTMYTSLRCTYKGKHDVNYSNGASETSQMDLRISQLLRLLAFHLQGRFAVRNGWQAKTYKDIGTAK